MNGEIHALAAQILDEGNAARAERRPPHTVTITAAEADALGKIYGAIFSWGIEDHAPWRPNRIAGVPVQVVD
jgi:hypothetical protein